MAKYTLPTFYRSLRLEFQGADPYVSTCESISIDQILSIEHFLEENFEEMQELVLNDKSNGYPATSIVINIHRTLKTFISMVGQAPEETINIFIEDSKEYHIRQITLMIEFLWINWLVSEYAPIVADQNTNLPVLPVKVDLIGTAESKKEKEEKALREDLYSVIIGTTPLERERIFKVLGSVLKGKGGEKLAPYLKAAIEAKLISRKPNFKAMKLFWGVTNTSAALSKYLSSSDCRCPDQVVDDKIKEIMYAISTIS